MKCFGMALTVGAVLCAGEIRLSGPVSGIVFDEPSRSLRWIVGVPGAAFLGPVLEGDLDAAAVSPNGRTALAIRGDRLFRARLGGKPPAWELLDAEAERVRHLVWSTDSSMALVAGASLSLWRHLDGEPDRRSLAGSDVADWSAFAIESNGNAVLAARPGGVYRLLEGDAIRIASMESPVALVLSAGGDVLFAADRSSRRVLAIRIGRDSAEVRTLAGGADEPVAMAMDGAHLLIATTGGIVALDPERGEAAWQRELAFEPTRLLRLASGVFALTNRTTSSEPLQVLVNGIKPHVRFVPDGR
jgi:hypothetical protein